MIVEDHQTLNLLVSLYNPSLCMKEACHSIFSQNSPPLNQLYIILVFVSYLQVLPVDPNCQFVTFTLQTSGTEPKIKYYIEVTTEPGTK